MSHDNHNNNGHAEKKPVAFTVPLILGLVTVFVILLFLSLGNPCHGHDDCKGKEKCSKECMEACKKGDHSKHPEGMKECCLEGKGCGKCEDCKEGKECSHMEKAGAECADCKEGKACAHHEKSTTDCMNCDGENKCEMHKNQAVETTEHTAEPTKEEAHQ